MPEVLCSFSWIDARLAIATGATVAGVPTLLVPDDMLLGYPQYLRSLALCGMLKYSNASLSAQSKVAAFLSNAMGLMDEHDAIHAALMYDAPCTFNESERKCGSEKCQ